MADAGTDWESVLDRRLGPARRYPIHWVEAWVSPIPFRKRRTPRKVLLAICGKTRAAITIQTHPLQSLVVHDFYLEKTGHCEEGERCFNRECCYNRTTPDSLSQSLGFKRRPRWLRAVRPIPIVSDLQQQIDRLCGQYPTTGMVSLYDQARQNRGG